MYYTQSLIFLIFDRTVNKATKTSKKYIIFVPLFLMEIHNCCSKHASNMWYSKHIWMKCVYKHSTPSGNSQFHIELLPSICHRIYFHTSKGHMTWIIKKVNRIPTHCGVAYESVHSLARGHMIHVCYNEGLFPNC